MFYERDGPLLHATLYLHLCLFLETIQLFLTSHQICITVTLVYDIARTTTTISWPFIEDNMGKPAPELTETLVQYTILTFLTNTLNLPFQASNYTYKVEY